MSTFGALKFAGGSYTRILGKFVDPDLSHVSNNYIGASSFKEKKYTYNQQHSELYGSGVTETNVGQSISIHCALYETAGEDVQLI